MQWNDSGFVTLEAAEAISAGQRVFINSSKKAEIAGTGVVASGVAITDVASGEDVSIKLLTAPGTFVLRAAVAITAGAYCFAAAAGEVSTTLGLGEMWRARQAASADDALFEAELVSTMSPNLAVQPAPTAKTTAATLTIAELLTGLIVGTHPGGGASVALTLPLVSDIHAALPDAPVNTSFEFTVINVGSAAAADVYTVTTNTGWTLTGHMAVANTHATTGALTGGNVGRFRARKTADDAWTLYRIA